MNDTLKKLFVDNWELDEAIEEFCAQNPEYITARREFYEIAHEIAGAVGYDLYNRFEQRFGSYMNCACDIYYLFGLRLRQEIIFALQAEMP